MVATVVSPSHDRSEGKRVAITFTVYIQNGLFDFPDNHKQIRRFQ